MAKKINGYARDNYGVIEFVELGKPEEGAWHEATLVVGKERVFTETEVRAMKEAGEALDRKFIDLVAFASVHLPSKCLQELVDDWAGHDERAAWKEASKAP